MSKVDKKFLLVVITLLFIANCIFCMAANAAKKITIILFCAEWKSSCRAAKQAVSGAAEFYSGKVDYKELNVDDLSTPQKVRSMNLTVPDKIPYIVVINKKGKIIAEKIYSGETDKELKDMFDSVILSN